MLSSVFLKTIRDLRGQALGWGAGMAAMAAGIVLIFPSFQHMPDVESFLNMFPEGIRKLVGDPSRITSLEGFLDLKLFDSWLPIFLAVFAIVQGAAAVAGEEESGTMDLLMANPIVRWRIVVEKYVAVAVAVTAMCVLIALGLAAAVKVSGVEADTGRLVLSTFNVIPVSLVLGAIALVGSCVFRRHRHASALAIVVMAASYFVYVLGPMTAVIRPWLKLSLFHYYGRTKPFGPAPEVWCIALLVGIAALLVALAAAMFCRKNLTA